MGSSLHASHRVGVMHDGAAPQIPAVGGRFPTGHSAVGVERGVADRGTTQEGSCLGSRKHLFTDTALLSDLQLLRHVEYLFRSVR